MKILTLIDSFKGTITSKRLGEITKEVLTPYGHFVKSYAISDGGDGFLDAISENIALKEVKCQVHDPLMRLIDTNYLVSETTAYIELAKASGINLLKENELNPSETTTFGFGEMIKDAIEKGYKDIVIGIGGSATNDGGSGFLEALGVVFNFGEIKNMNNQKLQLIKSIDTKLLESRIKDVSFTVLSDVTNPLLGPTGATYVFSPQKGAKKEMLPQLEKNMSNYSSFNPTFINYPGSGAAGGVGYALKTYLKAEVISGIDYILKLVDYENIYKEYDLIITGEGKIDSQSLQGKVISSIMDKTKERNLLLVCAINELDKNIITNSNNKLDIISIVNENVTKEMSINNPEYYYKKMLKNKFN